MHISIPHDLLGLFLAKELLRWSQKTTNRNFAILLLLKEFSQVKSHFKLLMTLINLLEELLCSASQNLEERGPNDFPPLAKLSLDLEVQILSFDLVLLLGLGIVENLNHSVYLPLKFCIANRQHISNQVGHDNDTAN